MEAIQHGITVLALVLGAQVEVMVVVIPIRLVVMEVQTIAMEVLTVVTDSLIRRIQMEVRQAHQQVE